MLVTVNQDASQWLVDGEQIVMHERDNTLTISGASRFLMGSVVHKNDEGNIEITFSRDHSKLNLAGMRGGKQMLANVSASVRDAERRRLLQWWPAPFEWEAELGPSLRLIPPAWTPSARPLQRPVDGPREEGLPKDDAPSKKLPD